jgi:hypothetical protein
VDKSASRTNRSAAQTAIPFSSNSLNPNALSALVGKYARLEVGDYNYLSCLIYFVNFSIISLLQRLKLINSC